MADSVKTPYGILSYPNLQTPRPAVEGGDPRYSCVIIFDEEAVKSETFKQMKAAAAQAVREKWGENPPKNLRSPFRQCSEKDAAPFTDHPNGIFISTWSKQRPGVVGPDLEEILSADEVWAGQIVRASVRFFAFDVSGNRGVGCGLGNLQIVKPNMPRIDGRKSAKSEFDAVDTGSSADADDMF